MLVFLLVLVESADDDTPDVPDLRLTGRLEGRWKIGLAVVVTAGAGVVLVLIRNGDTESDALVSVSSLSTLGDVTVAVFLTGRIRRFRTTLLPTLADAESGSRRLNGLRTFDSAVFCSIKTNKNCRPKIRINHRVNISY